MSSPSSPIPEVSVEDRFDAEEALVLDPSSLRKDMYYRFVQDRAQNIAKKKARGFSFVSRTKDGVKTLVDLEKTADDTIRLGDMVLMKCPKAVYERRSLQKSQVVQQRLEATAQRLKEKADSVSRQTGIPVDVTENLMDKGEEED